MNCIVVDDNNLSLTAISQLVEQVDFLELKKECEDPVDAFNYIKTEQVDLVFLDIEMPGMSGIELIKNLEKKPSIIFVTAKPEYAIEAFELNVADYLVKPVTLSRFMVAASRAKDMFESINQKIELSEKNKDYIFVRSNSVLTKIKLKDIIYVQALGDYVNIFTPEKRHTVHITLRGMEEKLGKEKFYRLHRSYLVSLDHVDNIEDGTVYIGQHPLPIGEQFKKVLLKKLNLI